MKRYKLLCALVIGLALLTRPESVAAATPAGWFDDGPLYIKRISQASQPDNYAARYYNCDSRVVVVGGVSRTACFVATAFGDLSLDGVVRMALTDEYHQIDLPLNTQLIPQPGSDVVFVRPVGIPRAGGNTIRYYERFLRHVITTPSGLALTGSPVEQIIGSLSGVPYDVPLPQSTLQDNRIIISYDGRLQWADIRKHTVGVVASMKYQFGAYMLPHTDLSPSGDTAVSANVRTVATESYYGVQVVSTRACPAPDQCTTRHMTAFLHQAIAGLSSVANVRFVSDSIIELRVYQDTAAGRIEALYHVSPQPFGPALPYLAMGDSLASGEGAYQYRLGTDAVLNKCHTSVRAYSYVILEASKSVACSGARIADLNGTAAGQRTGQRPGMLSPSVLATIVDQALPGTLNQQVFLASLRPDAVTLSAGGNDVGFADILRACIDARHNILTAATCYPTFEDRHELLMTIRQQYDRLVELYKQTRLHTNRVYVIGYPQLIDPSGDCALNVQLNARERLFASQLTEYLNDVIAAAAHSAGVFYVDVSDALHGWRLCETATPAVHGLTAGDDALPVVGINVLGQESFHPNAHGHQLLAASITRQTNHLTSQAVAQPKSLSPLDDSLPILQVPKEHRVRNFVYYHAGLLPGVVRHGANILHMPAQSFLFAGQAVVRAVMHSTPVELGTFRATDDGGIDTVIHIPPAVPPGYHQLHLYGVNQLGQPIDVTQVVYVGDDSTSESVGSLSLRVGTVRSVN